jgi:eukaryotic-like serine/threonine-protein kinase
VRRTGGVPEKTITRQGTVLGTPFYMSPEQAQALPDVDERTDIWSVGAILYECLTGRPPHEGQSYEQVIVHICTHDAPDVRLYNPAVPEPVTRVIKKALCRDRDARFTTARQLLEALGEASEGLLSPKALKLSSSSAVRSSSPSVPDRHSGSSPDGTHKARTPGDAEPLGPTVEVGPSGPSRVGWSTTSGASTAKERRWRLAIGAGAAFALIVVAVVYSQRAPHAANATPTETARAPEDATAEPRSLEPQAPSNRPDEPAVFPSVKAPEQGAATAPRTSAATTNNKKATPRSSARPQETSAPQPSATQKTPPRDPGVAPQLKIKPE